MSGRLRYSLLGLWLVAIGCAVTPSSNPSGRDWEAQRRRMVEAQIRDRGITNARVLEAMRNVPRHLFVPENLQSQAHDDAPIPIGHGQTISQPYIVAYMTETIEPAPADRVLEIGTGSGYQAAVLAELVREVYTIEIVSALADRARETLAARGYRHVHARQGNGYLGWSDAAPFDKIVVTAAPEEIPSALVDQLAVGGIMVVPVGRDGGVQMMTVVRKTAAGVVTRETMPVRFVPMVGRGQSPFPQVIHR